MRICLTIKNFLKRWSFPLFLQWPETTSNIVEAFSFETCLNFPSQDLLKMQVAKPWHHACLHFNYSSLQHRLLFFEGSKIIQECTFSQPFIQPLNSGYIHTTDDANQKMFFSQTSYQHFSTCSTHQEHFTIMLVKWFNKMQVPGSLHWTILAYSHSVIYPCLRRLCLHLRMEFMEVFLITCHWGISCGMWHLLIQCLSVDLWSFSAWPIHWNFIKEKYGIEYKLSGFANLIC